MHRDAKLMVPEGNGDAQSCSIHEFFPIWIIFHEQVVVLLETQRDIYARWAGHAVLAAVTADFHQFAVLGLYSFYQVQFRRSGMI